LDEDGRAAIKETNIVDRQKVLAIGFWNLGKNGLTK
jgi:hypothetical protein